MPAEFQLLKGFCISCSGFNVNEKNDIHRRVDQLGGRTCTGLTTSVTQLVMKTIDAQSKKYRASEKASIPVVSLDFITECEHEASRRRKTVYDEDDIAGIVGEITERTRLPPFAGCRICTTGFSVEQREEIKRLVTTRIDHNDILYKNYADGLPEILTIGGLGSYHGELTPDCTHLIAASLTGQKCKYGRLWDVSIVSFEWFRKSVATGFRQDESKFALVNRASESPSQTPGSQGQRTPQSAMRSDSMQPSMVPQTRASDVEPDFLFCSDAGSRPVTRNRTAAGSMTTDSYDLPPGLTGPLDIDDDELEVIAVNPPTMNRPMASTANVTNTASRRPPTPRQSSSPLPPHMASMEPMFDSCRIGLSEASLSTARRKEWRTKIAEAGGIWIAEGAMDRHIRYLAAHNSQRSGRQPFCTHFVVDDSDELCSEDLATLQALESALAPPNQLAASMPDHLKLTGSSPLSSMGHLEFPMVVQSGWLRACWKAKQRVDEAAYLVSLPNSMAAARQESADTVPVPVSNKSDSQVMAESAKHVASSRRSQVSGVGAGSNGLAIPILRPQSSTSGTLSARAVSSDGDKRVRGTESMVGRPIGAAWEEPDPFMVSKSSARLRHENLLDTPTDPLFRRKRQRTLQHQDPLQHSGHGYAFGGRQETLSYMSSPLNFDLQSLHHLSPEPNPTHVAAHSLPLVARAPSRPVETAAPSVNNDSASNKADPTDLFAHCKFTSLGFSANDVATLERVVNEHGGSYINLLSCLPEPLISQQGTKALKSEASLRSALGALACFADGEDVASIYVVVHLSGLPEVHFCESVCENYPFMDVVTECWIEQCLQESVRYPGFNELANRQGAYTGLSKGQHVLFRPVRDHIIEGTGAIQLSISGYEGIERDHIGKLASVLKIPFSERFTRQTTHLICHSPFKGPKYDRAVRWGIPVVDSSWLYDIALHGSLDGGRARDVVLNKSSNTAKAPVDMEVDHRTRTAADQKMMPPPASVVRKTVQSPAATMLTTPNSIGKSKTLLKTPLSNISQREVSNGTPGMTPMDVSLERNMEQAIDRLSEGTGAAHATPTRASGTHMPSNLQTLGDHDDGDRSLRHVLDGVVIALTTRLYHRRNELTGIATELGCRILPRFDPTTTTHLVHQSTRENETLRDYKTATQHGINVVSPWWLYACRDMRERVREREYPYIYQPERRLRLVAISPEKTVPPVSAPMAKPKNTSGTSSRASSRAGRLAEPVPAAAGMFAGSNAGQRNSRAHGQTSQNTAAVGTVLPRHAETGAASTPQVPIPPAGTSTVSIGNLFGEKVARTRRRYRRAAGDPADSASGMSRIAGNGEKSASGAKRVAEPPSSEGADAQSLLGNGQATRSSSLHDAAGPAPVSSSEMGSKWWRNTGQQSVSPYGTGFPTDLYSQDFQFGGPGGVDRRISMGDAEVSPVSSGATHMDDTPVRPGDQRDDTPTKQQDSTSDQQPAIPLLSSPLAGQNTRIFYEEDAEARSERDKFLQQLKGKR